MKEIGNIKKYVMYTYLTFWLMILAFGGLISVIANGNGFAMQWTVVICSWSPTIVLVALSKKILNGISLKEFYKGAFRDQVSLLWFSISTFIIVGIHILSIIVNGYVATSALSLHISASYPAVIWSLIFSILQGASGEESGWRGYLLPRLEENYGFAKSNVILGFIWAFWHLPLWFITSGYTGWMLLQYIVSFIVCIVSFTVLMGWIQLKCRNLFLAFWMHFLFNFLLTTISVDMLRHVTFIGVGYAVVAVVIVMALKRQNKALQD